MTIKVYQSSAAFAFYTAEDLSVAYALVVADCVLLGIVWGQMPALSL